MLHADLHGGPARAPLALHRGAHDEAAGERPRGARRGLGERGRVDDELPAALGADGRLGDGDGALVGARVEDQLQAVAERVDGAALAPGLEPRPGLPAGRPRARGLEDEPGARVGAGDAAGARGRHERGHHRRRRHGGPRQVVDGHRPSLPLLAPRVRAVAAFAVEGAAQPGPQPAAGAPGHGRLRRQRSGQNLQRACEISLHGRNVQVHGCITGESGKVLHRYHGVAPSVHATRLAGTNGDGNATSCRAP